MKNLKLLGVLLISFLVMNFNVFAITNQTELEECIKTE